MRPTAFPKQNGTSPASQEWAIWGEPALWLTGPFVRSSTQALVVKLGPDSLRFELRAWTEHAEQWMQIRSDLAIAISSALAAEKIEVR